MKRTGWIVPTLYIIFLMLPIYWLINMSFKSTNEILGAFTLWPNDFTLDNYRTIFTDPTWYMGYVNSLIYVSFNTILSVAVALPAAYAFSRYRFLGDKHLFFWLLTNRMAPPAVFALPFFQLYSAVGLFDTHIAVALAHTLFNIPLAVWILEGFMSGVPKELDETAYVDGFEKLDVKQKKLIYHLSQAAVAGRDIFIDQKYEKQESKPDCSILAEPTFS